MLSGALKLKDFYEALRDNKREVNAESILYYRYKIDTCFGLQDGARHPEDWHNSRSPCLIPWAARSGVTSMWMAPLELLQA